MKIELELPYPPTINHYYRRTHRGMAVGRRGLEYRELVALASGTEKMVGPLEIEIIAHPPDRRKRDVDNILKALLDALEKAGIYDDDFQVRRLKIAMMDPVDEGAIWVSLTEI